jgi:ribosomal protein L21E
MFINKKLGGYEMRLHGDIYLNNYTVGDTVEVDVAYYSYGSGKPHTPRLVSGTVVNKFNARNNFGIMIGSGSKIHRGEGLQVEVEGFGTHWFEVSNLCQRYTGKGDNWHRVSGMRVIEQPEHITCGKCSKYFNNPFFREK